MPSPQKYFLPPFLEGIVSLERYNHWLDDRAGQLFVRDKKRKIPYAAGGSKRLYKEAIDRAAQKGAADPFTGDALRWDLIGKWPSTKEGQAALDDGQRKAFALLPVVDHIDPYGRELEFEICSLQINRCKSFWTPGEFVDLCGRVAEYNNKKTKQSVFRAPSSPLFRDSQGSPAGGLHNALPPAGEGAGGRWGRKESRSETSLSLNFKKNNKKTVNRGSVKR